MRTPADENVGAVKLSALPENDLRLELSRFSAQAADTKSAHVHGDEDGDEDEQRGDRVSAQQVEKAFADRQQQLLASYQRAVKWPAQATARICVLLLAVACCVSVSVVVALNESPKSTGFVALTTVAFVLVVVLAMPALRHSPSVWMAGLVCLTLWQMLMFAGALDLGINGHDGALASRFWLSHDNDDLAIKALRDPVQTMLIVKVFALSGLPVRLVLLTGAFQMVMSVARFTLIVTEAFPASTSATTGDIAVYFGMCLLVLFSTYDSDRTKWKAYGQHTRAERAVLSELCQQEASNQHKKRVVSWILREVAKPAEQITALLGVLAGSADALPPDMVACLSAAQASAGDLQRLVQDSAKLNSLETGGFVFSHKLFRFSELLGPSLTLATDPSDPKAVETVEVEREAGLAELEVRGDLRALVASLRAVLLCVAHQRDPGAPVRVFARVVSWADRPERIATVSLRVLSRPGADPLRARHLQSWQDEDVVFNAPLLLALAVARGVVEKGHKGSLRLVQQDDQSGLEMVLGLVVKETKQQSSRLPV